MKKYNRDKRASYKTHARNTQIDDNCDATKQHNPYKNIHISVKYDGYNRTQYDNCIPATPHRNNTRKYVGMINAINSIFNTDKPQLHTANAKYKAFIPQQDTDYQPPEHMMDEYTRNYTETKRVKCIIFNTRGEMMHYGTFIRTINMWNGHATYTLHRANRSIEVKLYHTAHTIKGYTEHELHEHNVELYQI